VVTLQYAVLSNVGWAAILALMATVAGRVFRQRPALIHGLWLLVLLKLVTPSLVYHNPSRDAGTTTIEPAAPRRLVETPRTAKVPGPPANAFAGSPAPLVGRSAETRTSGRDRVVAPPWLWRTATVVLWLAGAAAWWSAVVAHVCRFRRLIEAARPAPDILRDRAGRLAAHLGLHRAPAVWLVPARIPPMLWALTGRPRLLLPEDLWGRFDETQQETVLVHELAHLKRRDHWVRWLEAVVLGLYWWNPVAWWARRQVEKAEELCCDAWVVWALPKAVEAYAEALVTTTAFLSGPRTPWPVGATGVGRITPIRRRLSMILSDTATGTMARPAPRAALILGALLLLVLPAWVPGYPSESARLIRGAPTESSTALGAGKKESTGKTSASIHEVKFGPGPTRAVVALANAQGVAVSQPLVREVSDYEDFVGRVEAAQTITIRARVGGILDKAHAQTGKVAEKGELLFEIDPRPYQAELEKAEAEVKRSEAQWKRRSTEMRRAKSLQATGGITQDEFDRIEGDRDEAEASLQGARATRELARLRLDSTRITAPIRGNVSRPHLSAGDLVVADTTVLATISTSDPMCVGFDIDERTVLRLGRESRGRTRPVLEAGLPIVVGLVDEEGFPRRGQVDSVDTRFDAAIGALHCRAVIPNADGFLLPGLFARVRLITSTPSRALLVSEGAVLTLLGQSYLFVVDDRDVVERRTVRLGVLHDGLRAVKEGLKEGEWVVVGIAAVKAGMTVKPERVAMPTRTSTPLNRRGQ
jgi:RND family efflux transporter MFP subunit